MRKHTINVLVENKFGVLARIAGMFSGRGYNIESISVGAAEEPGTSRMTIVSQGEELVIEQIIKQLGKVIEVIKVTDLTDKNYVEREMALIKVDSEIAKRAEIIEIAEIFRANIVDISPTTLTIEATGNWAKVQAIIGLLRPFGIRELARTGRVAMRREFAEEFGNRK